LVGNWLTIETIIVQPDESLLDIFVETDWATTVHELIDKEDVASQPSADALDIPEEISIHVMTSLTEQF